VAWKWVRRARAGVEPKYAPKGLDPVIEPEQSNPT
jgi:hypothetical protein